MGKKDNRVNAYIAKAQPFAKPILNRIRTLVHKAVPEAEEIMKWSFPHFDYRGEMMCSMASFREHATFTFWKASIMKDPKKILETRGERAAMGNLGRITGLKDLPPDRVMIQYLKEAAKLNDKGIKLPSKPVGERKELKIPGYFINEVSKNRKAMKTFEAFSYSHKKEYVEWITEAKTEETRSKRIQQAIEWMTEGKHRNWKYAKRW